MLNENVNVMFVHNKAIRLLEGGIVNIEGNWFRLSRFPEYYDGLACNDCDLDSLCREEHQNICALCDALSGRVCCLQLVTNRQR